MSINWPPLSADLEWERVLLENGLNRAGDLCRGKIAGERLAHRWPALHRFPADLVVDSLLGV
jgi:hypothetical protein